MCEPRFDIDMNPFQGLAFAFLLSIPCWAVVIYAGIKIFHAFVR